MAMPRHVFMFRPPPPLRDVRYAMGAHPRRLFQSVQVATRHAADLRTRLRELDLLIARAWDVLDFCGVVTPAWPPLHGPVRPLTLHEAMVAVLEVRQNGWMRTEEIAMEVARRGLYRRRDGLPATAADIAARVRSYNDLFERQGYVVRLRGVPPPPEP
jgi:hypothetical protein